MANTTDVSDKIIQALAEYLKRDAASIKPTSLRDRSWIGFDGGHFLCCIGSKRSSTCRSPFKIWWA